MVEQKYEEVWYEDFPSLYGGLHDGEVDWAVAAYSTVNGKAQRSVDELTNPGSQSWASKRGLLPVRLNLVAGSENISIEEVRKAVAGNEVRVYAQLEAYMQCVEKLKIILPGALHVIVDDTAGGVQRVVESANPLHLALASPHAATANGGTVISEQLNSLQAVTSFMLLSRDPIQNPVATSSLIVVEEKDDKPGVLVPILSAFADREINLAHLDADKELGRFVIEAEAGLQEEGMQDAIRTIQPHAGEIRFVGSFHDIDLAA
jgi:prephenate dehydratase